MRGQSLAEKMLKSRAGAENVTTIPPPILKPMVAGRPIHPHP